MLFSSALTGKPTQKEEFSEYRWKRCVIGTRDDYLGLRLGPGPVLTRFTWKICGVDAKAIAKCGQIQLPKS